MNKVGTVLFQLCTLINGLQGVRFIPLTNTSLASQML
jgi:hypothetical protein